MSVCTQMCEDLEDEDSLHHLYVIVKGTIMLNSIALMEILFAEDNVMDVVGAPRHITCS